VTSDNDKVDNYRTGRPVRERDNRKQQETATRKRKEKEKGYRRPIAI